MKTIEKLTAGVTPIPWSYIVSKTLVHVETEMSNPAGAGIAVCSIPKKRERDAKYIITAGNYLPRLVEALEELSEDVECYCADNVASKELCGSCKARAVLAELSKEAK